MCVDNFKLGITMNNATNKLQIITTDLPDHSVLKLSAKDVVLPLSNEMKDLIKRMREYILADLN